MHTHTASQKTLPKSHQSLYLIQQPPNPPLDTHLTIPLLSSAVVSSAAALQAAPECSLSWQISLELASLRPSGQRRPETSRHSSAPNNAFRKAQQDAARQSEGKKKDEHGGEKKLIWQLHLINEKFGESSCFLKK